MIEFINNLVNQSIFFHNPLSLGNKLPSESKKCELCLKMQQTVFHPLYTCLPFNLMVPFMGCLIPVDNLIGWMDIFFPTEVIRVFERVSQAEKHTD